MADLKKNILLTGAPSSGKTTVIRRLIERLPYPAAGFYTEEEVVAGRRVGFVMRTLDGKAARLAHQDIRSRFHISKYGVSIDAIEAIAAPSIAPFGSRIIILDEIGKMECCSEAFKKAAVAALDSPNILIGTITLGGDNFISRIRSRKDIELHVVTPTNRDSLPDVILSHLKEILQALGAAP
jgi:nucleoside-triphosphatase THEP1